MSVGYKPVLWNRQKRRYDLIMAALMALYVLVFVLVTIRTNPSVTAETLIIRTSGSLAILMLHVILLIGPLSRIWPKLLPLLYNRRHLGVTMCMVALIHGVFAIFQFHALGDTQPIVSVLVSNTHFGDLTRFPFQPLGLLALLILFLMAATSHDFWLHNLSPYFWKSLHMMVYVAYAALIGHVALGVLQYEFTAARFGLITVGVISVSAAHIMAGFRERRRRKVLFRDTGGMIPVCPVDAIANDRATIAHIDGEEIAIFKYDGRISAVHNLCKHQNGPLGEGRVIDGCITCPWHGYQYQPANGQSPPPFTEKVATYRVMIRDGVVHVDPAPLPEGTPVEPAIIQQKA
ncbi:MAG: ferric reductase-like transmembrane domain-containing protein [Saprospiraceae bacterium]|nr:ferric reductase-like transmembrane domain-containing protein [Saprospiraceae bacterium]